MKIWYQTATTYRYGELWEEYGRNLEEQCKRVLRPETEIYVTGVPVAAPEPEKYKTTMYFHQSQFIKNMLKAEQEGYDAYVMGSSYDQLIDEAREMLSIPVVSIMQSSAFLAAMLGELFAIVTSEYFMSEKYRQMMTHYGLLQKYLQGPYVFESSEAEMINVLKNPEPIAKKFKAVAQKAAEDGASVIIPIPAFVAQVFYKTEGLTSIDGATILDPVAVSVKFAEMMVDLQKIGIEVSRTLQVYASPGKELTRKILDTYADVFKIDY